MSRCVIVHYVRNGRDDMAWRHRLGNTAEGAVSWGSTGAAIGSMIPGVGTAVGGGVGAGIGALIGLFSDTEQQELAERWSRGEIDDETLANIQNLVRQRFSELRKQQGGRLARAGIKDSSIAERMRSETDMSERDAFARALLDTMTARQQMGQQMLSGQRAASAATWAGAVDNIMGTVSSLKADARYAQERADQKEFHDRWFNLANAPISPHTAKAAKAVGMMPKGSGRGSSGWGNIGVESNPLEYRGPGNRKSVLSSRQGGGWSMTNKISSGAHNRGQTWRTN